MMASIVSAGSCVEFVEERLLNGMFTGQLLQHKELLDCMEDVDAKVVKQSTLLHVGVRFGKADWVEELLARGADPGLKDDSQLNALSSAKEMVQRFPKDSDRSEVLKLITLVHRRDEVVMRRLESSSSRSTAHTTPTTRPDCNVASLKTSLEALIQEIKSLGCQLRSSLKELKAQVCGRDTLLRCLEEAVTSTVEDVTAIKFGLRGEIVQSPLAPVVRPPPSDPAKTRQECVHAMLGKTEILYGDEMGIMRKLYERLYDEDDCTACVLKYLSGDDRAKVLVDSYSSHIGRMKRKVMDASKWNGDDWYSFCDLETETVYIGTKVCWGDSQGRVCAEFAWALSQLSMKLAFCNGGRPYCDAECELEWMSALQKVEERRKRGVGLHWWLRRALGQRTLLMTMCYLAAAVPAIITFDGSKAGRLFLQKNVPLLFTLYLHHVVPTLLDKAEC
ncbi:uncharacterized protein LOC124173201 [Ischnura elegans]|uniref:uncharacterized protein LOC124173201 n=1 Tax=Ischnura elegans TaxID=197161 RepID=UPI001ED88394|nr:uncharacterized protein LOC124173201 [Ischnura elegans]XP_046408687.1 uncharacterized protein LOC124173201 [Ischnura elegans]XP_046408688.1 uncharacterized protein LOC124173201 [Ischnura elegans]XP_046408689.1 uncharacterized protein LOC124173201 [Ischnura elegans]XP_046408690.1 uncharacterized protein LOC124173201 [Ischnura elegans]XP_046408691.1 uncharacterized protein LOC124173201 [Ischnura elegans]